MLPLLTLDQLRDWEAKFDRDPWGESRADLRQTVLLRMLALLAYPSDDEVAWPSPFYPYTPTEEPKAEELLAWLSEQPKTLTDHADANDRQAVDQSECDHGAATT